MVKPTGAVSDDRDAERRDGDVACGQSWVSEVSTFLIVITHVESAQLGEVDTQSAAAVVDVCPVQCLQ